MVLGHRSQEKVGRNLQKQRPEEVEEEEAEEALLRLLCRVQMGQEEVVNLWSAVQTTAGEEAGCGKTLRRGSEVVKEAAVVEGRLCLSEGAGGACLHVLELAEQMGALAAAGPGGEAGGQSGLDEVEGPGERN